MIARHLSVARFSGIPVLCNGFGMRDAAFIEALDRLNGQMIVHPSKIESRGIVTYDVPTADEYPLHANGVSGELERRPCRHTVPFLSKAERPFDKLTTAFRSFLANLMAAIKPNS